MLQHLDDFCEQFPTCFRPLASGEASKRPIGSPGIFFCSQGLGGEEVLRDLARQDLVPVVFEGAPFCWQISQRTIDLRQEFHQPVLPARFLEGTIEMSELDAIFLRRRQDAQAQQIGDRPAFGIVEIFEVHTAAESSEFFDFFPSRLPKTLQGWTLEAPNL